MNKITIVPTLKKFELRELLNEYLTELAEFDNTISFDENKKPIYKYFECYFVDKDRFPFFFFVNNKIAGFCLVREIKNLHYEIAEFYIIPEFRNKEYGKDFAKQIADTFMGEIEFSTRKTNERAVRFWNGFSSMFEDFERQENSTHFCWSIRTKDCSTSHTLNLNPVYYDLMDNGEKIFEGRLNDEKRQSFNVLDTVTFFKEPDKTESFDTAILNKFLFKNFDEMANTLDKEKLGFKDMTKEEMVKVYRSFYPKDREEKYGVVVFEIRKI